MFKRLTIAALLPVALLPACSPGSPPPAAPTSTRITSTLATPSRTPSVEEVRDFEGDTERGAPGTALNLSVSNTTRTKLIQAYRKSPTANLAPHLRPVAMFYGKVFGRTPQTDTYYAIASLEGDNGKPKVEGLHVWTKAGQTDWRYRGEQQHHLCVPDTLYDAWNIGSKKAITRDRDCPA